MMRKRKHITVLVPFVVILLLLFLVDRPVHPVENPENLQQMLTEPAGQERTEEKSGQEAEHTENSAENTEIPDRTLPEITLITGKTGSLYEAADKVYEPVYAEPDETSEEVAQLQYNCAVLPADTQPEPQWICVNLQEKGTGYVKKDNVDICTITLGSEDSLRNEIVTNAFSYLGLKFKRYGTSLTEGIDCTNFFSQIYALSHITVPNTPFALRDLGLGQGKQVSDQDARPGDLVYYDKANDGDGHVGLYLGDGFIINASGHSGRTYPEGGVRICRLLYTDRDSYQIYDILGDTQQREVQ